MKLRASQKVFDRDIAEITKLTDKLVFNYDAADIAKLADDENKMPSAANGDTTDTAEAAALETPTVMAFSSSTRVKKIMHQLVTPPDETMKSITKVLKEMIVKLKKLNKNDDDENRMMFCKQIAKDLKSCEAPFKDHQGITYKEHSASECIGLRGDMGVELASDSVDECQAKCNELGPDCAGFLRMTSGLDKGKCLFKKAGIKDG